MKTITFYSYKGGTGRSLALANAARYLARLDFRIVALDFDLEAPGLHYKFALDSADAPLTVGSGIVDYLYEFVTTGQVPVSLREFVLDIAVPGIAAPLIHLVPAGRVPSAEYFSKLARLDWHKLFYSEGARGVQVFVDLKNRISDELSPDYLLIDSRTGITEMGGAATTLLADHVVCLVLPNRENLEGARAVLRSLKRSRRDFGLGDIDLTIAVSRLPEGEAERETLDQIQQYLSEEAEDLRDTIDCSNVYVLHSENVLQSREVLRVGGGVTADDSVLLRDYLRLFANVVSAGSVKPKIGRLIEQAKGKIWEDPEAALKQVEEMAESFGVPDLHREVLRFYEVRNIVGEPAMRRAQRVWELTGDVDDPRIWNAVQKSFELVAGPAARRARAERKGVWKPNLQFVTDVWRSRGRRNTEFAATLASAYEIDERHGDAAEVLLEAVRFNEASASLVARCVHVLDGVGRSRDADEVITVQGSRLGSEEAFVEAWARHLLRGGQIGGDSDIFTAPRIDVLIEANAALAVQLYLATGRKEQASNTANTALRQVSRGRGFNRVDLAELAQIFKQLGRWDDFENAVRGEVPEHYLQEMKEGRPSRRW